MPHTASGPRGPASMLPLLALLLGAGTVAAYIPLEVTFYLVGAGKCLSCIVSVLQLWHIAWTAARLGAAPE